MVRVAVSFVVALSAVTVQAASIEVMHTPSISSMRYRTTGDVDWQPAAVSGIHGEFAAPASPLVDIDIDGLFASHDFTGMTAGAFVTVVGKQQDQWAFNYDTYIGDEVTRWLPVSSPVASIPEPATALLAACGLLLCVVLRR